MDAPDKVDPTEIKRCMLLGTLIGWMAASYDEDSGDDLVELTCWYLDGRVDRYARDYLQLFSDTEELPAVVVRRTDAYLELLRDYWIRSIESIVDNLDAYSDNGALENARDRAELQIARHREEIASRLSGGKATEVELTPLEDKCRRVVPQKLIDLPFSGWKIIGLRWELGLNKCMNNDMVHEMLNFANGQRNLLEIRDAVSAEYREVEIEHVRELFDALEEMQIVRYRSSG